MVSPPLPEKLCASCGRPFAWRKKWADCWEEVKYCSDRCRRHKPNSCDAALETAILTLLDARAPGATICPSEATRQVFDEDWREHMERTREAARRLAAAGKIEIVQQGKPVSGTNFRGPIRLRRVHSH